MQVWGCAGYWGMGVCAGVIIKKGEHAHTKRIFFPVFSATSLRFFLRFLPCLSVDLFRSLISPPTSFLQNHFRNTNTHTKYGGDEGGVGAAGQPHMHTPRPTTNEQKDTLSPSPNRLPIF